MLYTFMNTHTLARINAHGLAWNMVTGPFFFLLFSEYRILRVRCCVWCILESVRLRCAGGMMLLELGSCCSCCSCYYTATVDVARTRHKGTYHTSIFIIKGRDRRAKVRSQATRVTWPHIMRMLLCRRRFQSTYIFDKHTLAICILAASESVCLFSCVFSVFVSSKNSILIFTFTNPSIL